MTITQPTPASYSLTATRRKRLQTPISGNPPEIKLLDFLYGEWGVLRSAFVSLVQLIVGWPRWPIVACLLSAPPHISGRLFTHASPPVSSPPWSLTFNKPSLTIYTLC